MLRLNGNAIMIGVVILALFAAGAVDAKPWRNIDSILASRIKWIGLSGTDGADKTHLYSIKAQGSIFKPYPQQPPYPANVQAYVETWLSKHPEARVIPVEAYPFLSVSVARVYVWIVDGEPALNGRTGKILSETWLYQAWRGNKVQPVSIMTDPPVEPGPHTLTGVLTVRYLTGVSAWNAAGQRKPLPDGVPTLLEERFDIDLGFTMADY
jgi:hypothetical protein